MTLPIGVVASYSYDNGSQLTSIKFGNNSGAIGDLEYAYGVQGVRRVASLAEIEIAPLA